MAGLLVLSQPIGVRVPVPKRFMTNENYRLNGITCPSSSMMEHALRKRKAAGLVPARGSWSQKTN